MSRFLRVIFYVFFIGGAAYLLIRCQLNRSVSFVQEQPSQGQADIGGDFELTDQHGRIRHDKEFRGKFMLVYFGYSFCPDICPMGLDNMTKALKLLGRDREQVAPIFITVDPKRDTIKNLNLYAQNFHPDFIMLTGSKDQIDKAKENYKVYAKIADTKEKMSDYLIDHSTLIYLMDRAGKFLQMFPHTVDPEKLARIINQHIIKSSK